MRNFDSVLVTGGAGFIGSNFIRSVFKNKDFHGRIVNVDKLTYAGNILSLKDIVETYGDRYKFEYGDICSFDFIRSLFEKYEFDLVCHFAAESHVDRSISGPAEFIKTNIIGTFNLLECAKKTWVSANRGQVFHHVSTDEVFGSLGKEGYFTEKTAYDPRSPYSASKASSDHIVMAYHHTYGLPVTMSNCSNNYGPFQFPEKLIPVMIEKMINLEELPIYGDGRNVRDWVYVEDHNNAVWEIVTNGRLGETYNIGGENEWENIELVNRLCEIVSEFITESAQFLQSKIKFIKDRPGHDRRYAIDCTKIKEELGWERTVDFNEGLRRTVSWYIANKEWMRSIKSGEYLEWMNSHYNQFLN